MSKTIMGIFESEVQANECAEELRKRGLRTDEISILSRSSEKKESDGDSELSGTQSNRGEEEHGDKKGGKVDGKATDNISDGILSGGALGGIAGLLAGAGTIAIPGLGILAAAGPVTGLISGLAAGGLIGGLIDLGIPEPHNKEYERYIKDGKVLFSMKTGNDNAEEIMGILKNQGADKVQVH